MEPFLKLKHTKMKNLLFVPALLLTGLVACNSGSNSSPASSDSTAATSDSSSMSASKMASSEASVAPLPAIPKGAKVFFRNLRNGQTVTSPFKIEMGAKDIAVDSAGTVKEGSGHFHILVDAGDSVASGIVIPKDSTHIHFGDAQKVTTLHLSPGKHRLALQFADGIHRSYGKELSDAITITVKK